MDAPMHVVSESPLQDVYERLTKRTFNSADRPVVACYVCYSQLWKSYSLMIKAEKADELLTQVLHSGKLDRNKIASVDRNAYNLIETLSISPTDCFEVAASECNMIELVEVTVKDELQLYPIAEETQVIDVGVKQERPRNLQEIKSIETEFQIQNIMCSNVNSQVSLETSKKPSNIRSDSQGETTLRPHQNLNKQLERGETSGNIHVISGNNRQVSHCRSNVKAAMSSNNIDNNIDIQIKKFICGDCGKTFSNKFDLMEHRGFTEKPFECKQCTFKTNNKSSLKAHEKIHSERNFQCTICDKKFQTGSYLKSHSRVHTREKPYECTVCQRRFARRSAYWKHLKYKEKVFECDMCQYRFKYKGALVAHIRTHTGERPFKCTICLKRFKMKDALNIHMRSHTGEKPYECTVCKQKYSRKRPLLEHILKHHAEEKPFECRICKEKFRDRDGLNNHFKEHSHVKV